MGRSTWCVVVAVAVQASSLAAGFGLHSEALAGRSRGAVWRRRSSRLGARLEIDQESEDFLAASRLFVDAFWLDKAETDELKEKQRARLQKEQLDEFRRRYGYRANSRRKSAFFVARGDDGVPAGCVGVELDGAAGDKSVVPVLSNLAVFPTGRRKGLGGRLVKACEKSAREWGCGTMTLIVETKNTPARRLYSKLGYSDVDTDENAKTLVPMADGRVVSQPTTTVTMSKDLGGGAGALLAPLAAAVALGAAATQLVHF